MAQSVDTSMYNTDPSQGMNKLLGAVQFNNANTQNQLLQQDLQGKQGLASLYANAPKDASGMPDPQYIMNNAGQAGIHAQDAIQGAQAIQNQKATIQRNLVGLSDDKLKLGKNINDTIVSVTTPMLSDIDKDVASGNYDPDAMQKKVGSGLASVIASSTGPDGNPVFKPAEAVKILGNLDYQNPHNLRKQLQQRAAQAQYIDGHLTDALNMKRGALGQADMGTGTQPTTQDMISGQVSPAGQIVPTGQSFDASTGRPQYNSNMAPSSNQFSPSSPQNPNNALLFQASANAPMNASDLGRNTAIGTTAPMPPGANSFRNALPSAPPGYIEAATQTSADNAGQAMNLQKAAATVPQQKALLGNMESKLGDFSSGPGSSAWKQLAAGVQRVYGGNAQSIASQEDFNKMAGMIAQQQFQSLGGTGTDAKLDSAMSTSPNSALSGRGNKEIIHMLKGNADALSAMNSEWQQAQLPVNAGGMGQTPQDFGKFQAQFNRQYDPRAFQLQYMNPSERKQMLTGMAPSEKATFKNAVNTAVDKGWIPGGENGQ